MIVIPLNYWLTGHPGNFKIKLRYFRERLSLDDYFREVTACFTYVSGEITNFQKDQIFKEYS